MNRIGVDRPARAPRGASGIRGSAWIRRAVWLDLALVLAAIVAGSLIRSRFGYSVPSYNPDNAIGSVKSDPALLYWFTERIAENHGAIPADFAASKMVQWPDPVDLRVQFPMAQPWLAANAWRVWNSFGTSIPLHTFCIGFFAIFASLTAAGVYGLARELTGRRDLSALALLLWLLSTANYRTLGFVLLGEDLSFPALAIHLWLVVRAARLRTPWSFVLAGVALLVAMASWHAAGFFVAMEAGAIFLWYLRSGQNPFSVPRSWLVLVPLIVGCVFEPMLRNKLQILSLPMQLAFALLLLAWIERKRTLSVWTRTGVALGAVALLLVLGVVLSRMLGSGLGDYSHVFRLIAYKLRFLGQRPADPKLLPFEVRILWQGPFDTSPLTVLLTDLGFGLIGLLALPVLCARSWWRGGRLDRERAGELILALVALLSLLTSWLIVRVVIIAGFLAPIALALVLRRLKDTRLALAGLLVAVAAAGIFFPKYLAGERNNPWHRDVAKLRLMARMVREKVPAGEALACDEIGSTAMLAHTGHPILAQPKYEWTAARERLQEFRQASTLGTPSELAAFLDAHDCRYVLLDTSVLWGTNYQVGLPSVNLAYVPGSALAVVAATPEQLPGFKLLAQYRDRPNPGAPGPQLFLALYQRAGK